jgi:hypothetical protein
MSVNYEKSVAELTIAEIEELYNTLVKPNKVANPDPNASLDPYKKTDVKTEFQEYPKLVAKGITVNSEQEEQEYYKQHKANEIPNLLETLQKDIEQTEAKGITVEEENKNKRK